MEGHLGAATARLVRDSVPGDPWNRPDTWAWWAALLPHVLATCESPHVDDDDVAWLLDCAGTYRQTRGDPWRARPLFEQALAHRRRLLGEDAPDALTSANNLALDLHALGDPEGARALHLNTLARRRRVLGEDHPSTLTSASNLAAVVRALGDPDGVGTERGDVVG